MPIRDQLRGTGVALVTPFNEDRSVDYDSLKTLLNFVIDGGANYVVVLGTTGESSTLTREEKIEIINFSYEMIAARVPVVVGIGGNNTQSVMKDIETFPLDKAAAILSASPYYSRPSQEGIYQHYKAIAGVKSIPIILYNVPSRTGSNITAATTVRLAKDTDNINGIKEASGNMNQCMEILRDKPQDFLVVSGDDQLALAQIACGMDGVISVAANCFPKDLTSMVNFALESDFHNARAYNKKLIQGYDLLFTENNPAGVKAFLAELGIIQNYLRLPLVPLSQGVLKRVREYLPTLK
jgi:4-hydroxy-tetrahydrodipicolinate synthase